MAALDHTYYCMHCHRYIFGETPLRLATQVNTHNTTLHPSDCANWTENGITMSAHYAGPGVRVKLPYTVDAARPISKEWGDAAPPQITEADRKMLAAGRVRW
jgi:hypothetical protein